MRAYEINEFGIDKLSVTERPEPVAGNGEVVVKFHAASLNFRDLMIVEGAYNPRLQMPVVPLSDGAGEVVSIGEGVTKWRVGDRVMPIFCQQWYDGESTDEKRRTALAGGPEWDGVLREAGAFSQDSLVRVPDHLSYVEAATLPCAALTAWHALVTSGGIKAGDSVLTIGTGGVSIFAAQIAQLHGAEVISTTGSSEKAAKLNEMGIGNVINYREDPDWDKEVMRITNRRGVDHVVEVGGSGTLTRSINSVRTSGHIAVIGAVAEPGDVNPITILMRSIRLQGIFTGSRSQLEELVRAFEIGETRPVIDRVFTFDQARDAMNYMKSGSHFGKVVINISE